MRFVGIDLAWGTRNTTAAVALTIREESERLTLEVCSWADTLRTDDDILAFVAGVDSGGGMLVGIDAPLDVPNETGERPVEAILRRCFGRYQAGAHPANRQLYGGDIRGERLAARLAAERGIINDPEIRAGELGLRRCIEVFPHPAQVVLFGLIRTLKYKAKPGRDYSSRCAEYARFVSGMRAFADAAPALIAPDWLTVPEGKIGGALKRYEDLLDALMCAYVTAYYWRWGNEKCMVIGDTTTGYIVTPITEELRACVETCAAALRQRRSP